MPTTTEQRLFTAANALFTAAGLTPTPRQTQENGREACDWTADIADGRATEADFLEATQARILDFLAERENA